ncbi:BREX-3 system P-loop-containing protein BrxF [Desulfonatronovibrio magnus]|uniref:BREX-3 system P-loop-containing protein BrxF n=1 Tax=Desulfonatronovibrio magnus TaxID=698827 RepID=UPI0005EB45BA|nr:BREX-3 system P-loop-containing protein BrxF [Desulfonatronovibrio magnus]
MSKSLYDKLISSIEAASSLYFRLIVLAGPSGSGKTRVLQELAKTLDTKVININLEVSSKLLELTQRQRAIKLSETLDQIILRENSPVIMDNIEILFDKTLKQNPLRLLQGMSRNKTILTAWNGHASGDKLVYAQPGHPEYQNYSLEGLVWVSME